MKVLSKNIPKTVVRRLPEYLACLQQLREKRREWISSRELADALKLTGSTVRMDILHLDFCGTAKRGYKIKGLQKVIANVLGLNTRSNIVIVGAGDTGRALVSSLSHDSFGPAFRICGIFDSNSAYLGKKFNGFIVQSMGKLFDVVKKEKIDIGIVAVPTKNAQKVVDLLVVAGVCGLLNFSPAHLTVPKNLPIVDIRMIMGLQELSCVIRAFPRTH